MILKMKVKSSATGQILQVNLNKLRSNAKDLIKAFALIKSMKVDSIDTNL